MGDGIHSMVSYDQMDPTTRKYWDFENHVPGARFYQREFGYLCLDRWYEEGLPRDADLDEFFHYDKGGHADFWDLGWTESGFEPLFEEKVLEDRGEYELFQDNVGRAKLCFKGRRRGFMPEYVSHPVTDEKSWEENCRWRLDPKTPARLEKIQKNLPGIIEDAKKGAFICDRTVGGYMYLRSLIGPVDLLYMFYDNPELIHKCMETWLYLADNVMAEHQKHVCIDEIFIGEDICYKNGALISPDMMKEFLLPYYQQLLTNAKARQIDPNRKIRFQVDTDGRCPDVIDLYQSIGMTTMSPFEVAAGCDILEVRKKYPDLLISGGVDKQILAKGKDEIDRLVDRIFPEMQKHGGYIPTCDHHVPAEVSLENYMHYRKRCLEFG